MKHETPTIGAVKRARTGSRYAQRLRQQGQLPAIIYGHGTDPLSVSVDEKTVLTLLRQGAHAIKLDVEGGVETCLVKNLQFGHLGDNVIHVDFTRVDLDEEVTVQVRLVFVGVPEEGKSADTVVSQDVDALSVTCRVQDIPDEIRVDLGKMEGLHLSASDIELPAGMKLADDPSMHVVGISTIRELEPEGEETIAAGEGEDQPEVITEAKTEE
jgi:large subunit ribosomal protein L25